MKLSATFLLVLSLGILTSIDTLFLYKYYTRINGGYLLWVVIFGYQICRFGLIYFVYKNKIRENFWLIISASLLLIGIAIFIFLKIDPSQTNVDRWDAIVYWWDALLEGKFPYSARTRWGGFLSPLPILQFVCFPFYYVGELGISILAAVAVLLYFIYYRFRQNKLVALVLILILTSTAFWWEISVRSTLFVNGLMVLFLTIRLFYTDVKNTKSVIIAGVIMGLILSSRMVVAIALLVYIGNTINTKSFFKLSLLVLFAFFTFCLTFLPLVLGWGFDPFLMNNPILHHDNHMPHIFTLILFIAALGLGFVSKSIANYVFSVGFLLICAATIFSMLEILKHGFNIAILENYCDISYFLLSYPCLLFCVANRFDNHIITNKVY